MCPNINKFPYISKIPHAITYSHYQQETCRTTLERSNKLSSFYYDLLSQINIILMCNGRATC